MPEPIPTPTEMLRKCQTQFRYYARNHREKADKLGKLAGADKQIHDTLQKAAVNDAWADEIGRVLTTHEGAA